MEKKEYNKKVAKNLKQTMKAKGIKPIELAFHSGVSVSTIYYYLAGHSYTIHSAYKIARALDVSLDAVFNVDYKKI